MPLLISSRMTSAGLTDSSSASSLTVIVPGSSMAPRSRGSSTWTCDGTPLPSRRGGFRGPRRPRVPLLLLAMCSSFVRPLDPCPECCSQLRREWCLERPAQGALLDCIRSAGPVAAKVRAPSRDAPAFVDPDGAVRRPNDPEQVAPGAGCPARDARPGGNTPCGRCCGARYDDTSPVAAGLFARLARFGAGSPVSVSVTFFLAVLRVEPLAASAAAGGAVDVAGSAFFVLVARFGFGSSAA